MSEYNNYNAVCPDDFELTAFKEGILSTENKQSLTEHLLLCSDCLLQLELLPWNTVEEMKTAMIEDDLGDEETEISPILKQAFDIYRKKQSAKPKENPQSLEEILNKDGIEVGQIWRTKLEDISVPLPDGEEKYSVSKFGSVPHLVVITNTSVEKHSFLSKHYRVIKVIPVDDNIQHARDNDIVFSEDENPLGYPFMLACWNQQEMLLENLDSCLEKLKTAPDSFKSLSKNNVRDILSFLEEKGRKDVSNASFSLFGIIEKGQYSDPAMRHRAREFENTTYLRAPVRELRESPHKIRKAQKDKNFEPKKRGFLEIIQGAYGDLRKKLTFSPGFNLSSQPSFKSQPRLTTEYMTEDELCQIVIYEDNGDTSVLVSSKALELTNREIILSISGENLTNAWQIRQKLEPFDKNWVSAEFRLSEEQRNLLSSDTLLQIELTE